MLTNFTKIYERPAGSLQGYINISPMRVADLLGRPNGYRDEKISNEWNICVDGVPLSVYYYYNDPLLHVAGASLKVVSKAEQLLQHPPRVDKEELVKTVFNPGRVVRMGGHEWLECV